MALQLQLCAWQEGSIFYFNFFKYGQNMLAALYYPTLSGFRHCSSVWQDKWFTPIEQEASRQADAIYSVLLQVVLLTSSVLVITFGNEADV